MRGLAWTSCQVQAEQCAAIWPLPRPAQSLRKISENPWTKSWKILENQRCFGAQLSVVSAVAFSFWGALHQWDTWDRWGKTWKLSPVAAVLWMDKKLPNLTMTVHKQLANMCVQELDWLVFDVCLFACLLFVSKHFAVASDMAWLSWLFLWWNKHRRSRQHFGQSTTRSSSGFCSFLFPRLPRRLKDSMWWQWVCKGPNKDRTDLRQTWNLK